MCTEWKILKRYYSRGATAVKDPRLQRYNGRGATAMKDPKQQRYPTKKDPRYLWKIYRMEDTKWKIWKIRNERYECIYG